MRRSTRCNGLMGRQGVIDLFTERTCHFSPCRAYRYRLSITWDQTKPIKMFAGLNPSTADEENDDPTVRRWIDYAERWGCGGILVANAFAFRSTDPRPMLRHSDPIGPENSIVYLNLLADLCDGNPIACWGTNAVKWRQGARVKALREARQWDCLRITKYGAPEHPLYLKQTLEPIPWNY